jgi:hypothetical protein
MGKRTIVDTVQEAQDLLRFCLQGGGEIVPGRHFRDELTEEGLTFEDAWVVLRTGQVFDPPEPDIRTGELKFRVEGHEPGGKWLVVCFSFKTISRAFLITIFSVSAKARDV